MREARRALLACTGGEARRDGRFGFGLVGGRTAAVSKGFHTVGWVMCAMAMYTGAVGEGQPPECLRKRRQAPTSLRRCRPRFPSVRRSPIIRSRTLRRLLDGLSCCCPDGRVEDMSASHQGLHSALAMERRGAAGRWTKIDCMSLSALHDRLFERRHRQKRLDFRVDSRRDRVVGARPIRWLEYSAASAFIRPEAVLPLAPHLSLSSTGLGWLLCFWVFRPLPVSLLPSSPTLNANTACGRRLS
jgi:hypothetical protein